MFFSPPDVLHALYKSLFLRVYSTVAEIADSVLWLA
jgi:hypothetical protein